MAATTKTLTPTNQVISIPAFTDKPDNRLQADSTGKLADAVNALNSNTQQLGAGSNAEEACQNFLSKMTDGTVAVGHLEFGGYSYVAICYKNSNNWATMSLFGYSGTSYHAYKSNGTWMIKTISES